MIMPADQHPQQGSYRLGVGIVLARADRKVFVGRRIKKFGEHAWQMPQGGIDADEEPRQAVWRELFEETGVRQTSCRLIDETDWLYYDIPEQYRRTLWNNQYIGQRQKWFLLHFTGDDSDIQLENDGAPAEFDSWKWHDFDQVDQLAVEFKQDLYRQVQKAFSASIGLIVA